MEKIRIEQIKKVEYIREDFEWLLRTIAEKIDNFVELNNFEFDT